MEHSLCKFCDKHCFEQFEEGIFGRWLVDVLSPVLMGVKPAEILSFRSDELHARDKLRSIERAMSICRCMRHMTFTLQDESTKIIFYHPGRMAEILSEPLVAKFLVGEGYPEFASVEDQLDHLKKRFFSCGMPHEIGAFLGYPIKDVLGFMGRVSLPCVKTQGWKVYGDPLQSDRRYHSFLNARYTVRKQLDEKPWHDIWASA